jgi:hypothetical protein
MCAAAFLKRALRSNALVSTRVFWEDCGTPTDESQCDACRNAVHAIEGVVGAGGAGDHRVVLSGAVRAIAMRDV